MFRHQGLLLNPKFLLVHQEVVEHLVEAQLEVVQLEVEKIILLRPLLLPVLHQEEVEEVHPKEVIPI
jgi:hypothetical protein